MRYAFLFVLAAGCNSSPCEDAAHDSCGGTCVDLAIDPAHCGACGAACSPAADCEEGCTCPASFIPAAPMFLQALMRDDIPQLPGLMTGIGVMADGDRLHGLLVAFDPATVPVGIDIDLATARADVLRIGFGYEVDPLMTIRGSFLATAGTLRLASACDEGVAGVLSNVTAVEIDLFSGLAPIPGGCTLAVPAVTFDIGEACAARTVSP